MPSEREPSNEMSDHKPSKPTHKDKPKKPVLDDVWPVHSAGSWPKDMSLDRADIYEDRHLTIPDA